MNPLLQWLASDAWTTVVKALLHTLWIGGLAAAGLLFVLRRKTDPMSRYRWCVGALLTVVVGGIMAWALLQERPAEVHEAFAPHPHVLGVHAVHEVLPSPITTEPSDVQEWKWTPWLALVWLSGMAVMLARAGSFVAEAERLRRRSRPLQNEAVLKLIADARQKLGLVREIKVVLTGQLTSPAVMGVLTPVLILPLSMVTTLPMEQLQLILLHELAHIRRGDYFVNLCQLVTEALLFFNPAVWWISRQIRQEREACCDAIAVALSGGRLQYAQTLADVAGAALAAAPAFSDERNPSGLKDRVQRLLVPGYRPALRSTWCALLAAFLVSGVLLFLSAMGARATVALLTPQQRMDRIEKKMIELGEKPVPDNYRGNDENEPKVKLSGRLRAADGSPVPEWIYLTLYSSVLHSSTSAGENVHNGKFEYAIREGTIYLGGEVKGFAPVAIGPLNGFVTNRFENLELVLTRGFDEPLQLVDADDGRPVSGAQISTTFWIHSFALQPHSWKSGAAGSVALTHCSDFPLEVQINAPGYEIMEKKFEHVRPNESLRVMMHRGAVAAGVVLDKTTGRPIAGATVSLLYLSGAAVQREYGWDDALHRLGKTDSSGQFKLNQLRTGGRYFLGVSARGHESIRLNDVTPGQNNLIARLGPELVVRGRVLGNTNWLSRDGLSRAFYASTQQTYDNNSYGNGDFVAVRLESGVPHFQFTNRAPGVVKFSIDGQEFERDIETPVDDWVIDPRQAPKIDAKNVPQRDVVFRFQAASGVPPRGTVSVTIPDDLNPAHSTAHMADLEITNGEVRAQIPVGGRTAIEPKRMPGYWFSQTAQRGDGNLMSIPVEGGAGPMLIDIPVVPAGAIYAETREADGALAGSVFFGVSVLKSAPGVDPTAMLDTQGDSFSDNGPRHWVSGPLPLGGTYEIHSWRGNRFCVSKPIKLTDAKPDAEIELQFPPGKTIGAVVLDSNGKPLRNAEVKASFQLRDKHEFSLNPAYTDDNGRFQIEDTTPESGTYFVEAAAPGVMTERVAIENGRRLQVIHLKQGRKMAGRVIESGSNHPIPGAVVSAYAASGSGSPTVKTSADAEGRFEFTTLGDIAYYISVEDAQRLDNEEMRAHGQTDIVLPVKLYAWSKIKPKAP